MGEKDFKSIKFLDIEIKRLKRTLNNLNSTNYNSRSKQEYRSMLQQRQEELIKKKMEIERFIASIDDAEIRLILTLKFIDLKSWNFISKTLHFDRTTLYKKYKHFIDNQPATTFTKSNN